MAGKGFPPKDPARRARRNTSATPLRVIVAEPVKQPPLPTIYFVDGEGKRRRFTWPERTRAWWKMWGDSPLSATFIDNDWSELLDTALLHAEYWSGNLKVANELRLRVANFGATPADRARLQIISTQADGKEKQAARRTSSGSAQRRYGGSSRAVASD